MAGAGRAHEPPGDDDRAGHEAEEQRGHDLGFVVQEVAQDARERQDGEQDAHRERDDEGPLDGTHPATEAGDVGTQQEAQPLGPGTDRGDEPFVDAEHERDRATRHARHDVRRAHGEAAHDREEGVEEHGREYRFGPLQRPGMAALGA